MSFCPSPVTFDAQQLAFKTNMDQAHWQNRWLDLSPSDWTPALAEELLSNIKDNQWIVQAAAITRADDSDAQLAILDGGINFTEELLKQRGLDSQTASEGTLETLLGERDDAPAAKELLRTKRELLRLKDATCTWKELYGSSTAAGREAERHDASGHEQATSKKDANTDDAMDEDAEASWAFDEDDVALSDNGTEGAHASTSALPPVNGSSSSANTTGAPSLPTFLSIPLLQHACAAASSANFHVLTTVFLRHAAILSPHRLAILDTIPIFSDVSKYVDLLPTCDTTTGQEKYTLGEPWRKEEDWTEDVRISQLLQADEDQTEGVSQPASAQQLSDWYISRVAAIDAESGQLDGALTLVQYGASRAVPGLDALGEELSLLSKLVYDRGTGIDSEEDIAMYLDDHEDEWTLSRWRRSSPSEIVSAYLEYTTPSTIPDDIRRLVLPYLYVLESQLERAGTPDPTLHDRLLHQWMLSTAANRLDLIAGIMEASKPTLSAAQRIVRDDRELAALALACVYGHRGTNSYQDMSSIFDCLPAFDDTNVTQLPNSSSPVQTLQSIFVSPSSSTSSQDPLSLYTAFSSWPISALSLALDNFDLHLEAGEIFSRWGHPVPLSFFVTLSNAPNLQLLWADKIAKTSAATDPHASSSSKAKGERLGQDFENEDDWISLLDDLVRLSGPKETYTKEEARPAFADLQKVEITKLFFAGLLSSAKFELAKSLFNSSTSTAFDGQRPLPPTVEQELVLAASREFYDNADSGNIHQGNMKLAFDCLAVAPVTPEIRKERDFIEATSRLSSFRVLNSSGDVLTPLEIRLTTDRLSLISRLLGSSESAYRHPEVVLDLVAKLGYRGDQLAEARVFSMLADAALNAGDTAKAAEVCNRMIKVVETIRRGRDAEKSAKAAEIAWRTCYQFGKTSSEDSDENGRMHTRTTSQQAREDDKRKAQMLGHALLLCPKEKISEVLAVWQENDSRLPTHGTRSLPSSPTRRSEKAKAAPTQRNASPMSSQLPSFVHNLHLPSVSLSGSRPGTPSSGGLPNIHLHQAESAARAAFSAGRAAANAYLPFRTGTPDRSASPLSASVGSNGSRDVSRERPLSGEGLAPGRERDIRDALGGVAQERVREKLSKGFGAGVSWLIGAEDE